MHSLYRTLLLSMLLLPLAACGLSSGPIDGQVLEVGTNKPIAGAIVIGRWQGTYSQLVESKTVCYHVETATTDAQGRYRMPAWHRMTKGPFFSASPDGYDINVYKPGYKISDDTFSRETWRKNVYLIEPFKGTRTDRLEYLERMLDATRCGSQNESERNLHAMYYAMYEEAKNIAVSAEDMEIVDNLRYWASFVLLDKNKPTTRDAKGRLINVDPETH